MNMQILKDFKIHHHYVINELQLADVEFHIRK